MRARTAAGRREVARDASRGGPEQEPARDPACADCLRRSRLLGELSPLLDLNCRADGRLFELLALDDETLIHALGGRRRAELQRSYASFDADRFARRREVTELCMHDARYPRERKSVGVVSMLHVAGGLDRLHELTLRPVVAIVGTRRASDYGRAMAGDLARGLSACGVTVAALRHGGVPAAALTGALNGETVTVAGSGLGVATSARRRATCAQLRNGCVVSELPWGVNGRRWGPASAERLLAALAMVTLVVEAHDSPRELPTARFARSLDRPVAAIPGRVTSPASAGCHALLHDGARLVRGTTDVLELLYDAGRPAPAPGRTTAREAGEGPFAELEPRLRRMLERVGAGADTPGKLAEQQDDASEVLRALSELELLGLLSRGDGGRYVVRASVRR
jgi:DNA processing protein